MLEIARDSDFVKTAQEWRAFRHVYKTRTNVTTAKAHAKRHGISIIHHGDDSVTMFVLIGPDLQTRHYPKERVLWCDLPEDTEE